MHERETPGLPLGWVKLGEASQVLRALAAAYGVPRCDDITRCGDGGCGRRTAIQARTDGGPMLDWQKDTICYKHVGELAIQADVYRVPGRTWQPVIVWIHGGALIAGNREAIAPWQVELYLQAGFCLVSIDYRLAPETKLPEIIADLRDAIRWVRRCGPGLFGLDPERLAVIGHSAGGYLTLMSGFCVQPAPRAIVPVYGYGDLIGSWYSQPDPFYCRLAPVPPETALGSVGQTPISAPQDWQRFSFYLYCRQQGLWPREVGGVDPHGNPGWFTPYCPLQNVTGSFAPALLLHGDQDTDVPYEQSRLMAAALQQAGVACELITLQGRGHGFDGDADAAQDAQIQSAFQRVLAFLREHCA